MDTERFVVGFEEEQEKFHFRNQKFILEFKELYLVMKKVFERPIPRDSEVSALVYALGAMAIDDFVGIYLLVANGSGREADKLLRGFYERTVTMSYLSKYPESTDDFIEYLAYERYTIAEELKKTKMFEDGKHDELLAGIQSDYDTYKRTHSKEEKCQCCGRRNRMPSWTKMGIAEMARKAGQGLDDPLVYLVSYLFPTKKFHVTPLGVSGFLSLDADDNLSLRWEPNPWEADRTLAQAHWLLVTVLEVQNNFFNLGLDDTLLEHDNRLGQIWDFTDASH